jgi:hypothetical protein
VAACRVNLTPGVATREKGVRLYEYQLPVLDLRWISTKPLRETAAVQLPVALPTMSDGVPDDR